MSSIHSLYCECMRNFQSLIHRFGTPESPASLRIDFGRFMVWAADTGAHQQNSLSLDYRLRDDSNVKQMVYKLLKHLFEALESAICFSLDSNEGSDSGQSWPSDSDESEDEEEESLKDESANYTISELDAIFVDISHAITCLYEFSITIKNPASRDIINTCQSVHIYTDGYDGQYTEQEISELFPGAKAWLTKRLAKAQINRRRYRYTNALKRVHGKEETIIVGESESEFDEDRHSQTLLTPIADPRNPETMLHGTPFKCLFCSQTISVTGRKCWINHVFDDLRPYVCSVEKCATSDKLYGCQQEWFAHELAVHRREWYCNLCDEKYDNDSHFRNHVASCHDTVFKDEAELNTIVDRCERACKRAQDCPLCGEICTVNDLQHHLGSHMQQIALDLVYGAWVDVDEAVKSRTDMMEKTRPHDFLASWLKYGPGYEDDAESFARRLKAVKSLEKQNQLSEAIKDSHEITARSLIKKGARINRDQIRIAVENRHEELVRMLLKHEIDAGGSSLDAALEDVINFLIRDECDLNPLTIVSTAIREASAASKHLTVNLLSQCIGIKNGVNISDLVKHGVIKREEKPYFEKAYILDYSNSHFDRLLMEILSQGHTEKLKLLLKFGLELKIHQKYLAISKAIASKNEGIVRLLFKTGDIGRVFESLALLQAVQVDSIDMIRLLIDCNAGVHFKDPNYDIVLQKAVTLQRDEIARFLVKMGAGEPQKNYTVGNSSA
ncbi:hypothetical protein EDC01DRAFT_642741 [Geopyxis carbonaria]|nr:hypothetical protein EDC01DRAFT_642741 [Geopyxis carbonaria]